MVSFSGSVYSTSTGIFHGSDAIITSPSAPLEPKTCSTVDSALLRRSEKQSNVESDPMLRKSVFAPDNRVQQSSFGSESLKPSVFGSNLAKSSLLANESPNSSASSMFGSQTGKISIFGSDAASGTGKLSVFGQESNKDSVFGSCKGNSSVFGSNSERHLFGSQSVKPSSIFGTEPLNHSVFGSVAQDPPWLGSQSTKPSVFGSTVLSSSSEQSSILPNLESFENFPPNSSTLGVEFSRDAKSHYSDVITISSDENLNVGSGDHNSAFDSSKATSVTNISVASVFGQQTDSSQADLLYSFGNSQGTDVSKCIFGSTSSHSKNRSVFNTPETSKKDSSLPVMSGNNLSSFGGFTSAPSSSSVTISESYLASTSLLFGNHPQPQPAVESFSGGNDSVKPTLLLVTGIPEEYMRKSILNNHFSRFGEISRISLIKSTRQARVKFRTHEEAALAKKEGKRLHPNIPDLMIFFGMSPDYSKSDKKKRSKYEKSHSEGKRSSRSDRDSTLFSTHSSAEQNAQSWSTPPQNSKPTRTSSTADNLLKTYDSSLSSSKNWLKSEKNIVKRDYKNIPSDLLSLSSSMRHNKTTNNRSSPVPQPSLVIENFAQLLKSRAISSQEKYNLLNSRDKLIRNLTKKELDVSKAKYLSAKCQDMCPEKERYMREVQYDLSPYEMTEDRTVCHSKAIKKFSRSSADKDEPLPHELRTGPVLMMTMDYLLCNILPKMDDGISCELDMCYNYIWDRSRAMRSDITQQHLVDLCAVNVLERCVRFHLYSSERLSSEPPDVFDPKLNTEHIQKSMQSLKELYHDLSLSNIYCDNEPEFRCYEILLNVYDGDVIFSFMNLRESVQSSPEVKFAVKVMNAIQTNNYVRFFKLAKEATYLQVCIMHRYFNRLRSDALNVMVRSLHSIGKVQHLLLLQVMTILGFENPEDTLDFLSTHNLNMSSENTIAMDKNRFVAYPQSRAATYRASKLVQSKKYGKSIAAILNGGRMPDNPLSKYEPMSSFSEGYLINMTELIAADTEPSDPQKSSGEKDVGDHDLKIANEQINDRNDEVADVAANIDDEQSESTAHNEEYNYHENIDNQSDYHQDNDYYDNNGEYYEEDDQFEEKVNVEDQENLYEENNQFDENDENNEMYYDDANADLMDNVGQIDHKNDEIDLIDEDTADENNIIVYENIITDFRQMIDHKLTYNCFTIWRKSVKFSKGFEELINLLTVKGSFEGSSDWRKELTLYNFEEILQNLYLFKLCQRVASRWKEYAVSRKNMKKARVLVLSRRVLLKWRKHVTLCQERRYFNKVLNQVRKSLLLINIKTAIKKWQHNARVKKATRLFDERRRQCLLRKYFKLWVSSTQTRKWYSKRLTEGFPASSSKLSLEEQNQLWNFACSTKTSFMDVQLLEKEIQQKNAILDLSRSLHDKICGSPLPLMASFEKIISSRDIPNSSKPKSFTVAIIFDEWIDQAVIDWMRMKLNISSVSKKMQSCFQIRSPMCAEDYSFEIIESSEADIGTIGHLCCIYLISDKTNSKQILHFNSKGIQSEFVAFKIDRNECNKPEMSLKFMETLSNSYTAFGRKSKFIRGDVIHITQTFVSKHVLQQCTSEEMLLSEVGPSFIAPAGYSHLLNRVVHDLKIILVDGSVRGQQWISSKSREVHSMNEAKCQFVAKALDTLSLSAFNCSGLRSWSAATTAILDYTLNNVCDAPQFDQLSSEILWFIDAEKEKYVQKFGDCDDSLPDMALLPWRKIYSAIISYKLCQLPSIDIIYCTLELSSYSTPSNWYLPYVTTKSSRSTFNKRKVDQSPAILAKKYKPDQKLLADTAKLKEELIDFEDKVKRLVEGCEYETVFPGEEVSAQAEAECQSYLMNQDLDLRDCIAREKERFSCLENKLNMLLD